MAKNDFILFIDDDIYPNINLINNILLEIKKDGFKNNPNLYGPFKRLCLNKYNYIIHELDTYTQLNLFKSNIVLTKLAIVNKYTAIKVWEKIKESKYIDIILKNKGNGEDIVFASFINILGGKNKYVPGKFYDLDTSGGYHSQSNHFKKRDLLCKMISKEKKL